MLSTLRYEPAPLLSELARPYNLGTAYVRDAGGRLVLVGDNGRT